MTERLFRPLFAVRQKLGRPGYATDVRLTSSATWATVEFDVAESNTLVEKLLGGIEECASQHGRQLQLDIEKSKRTRVPDQTAHLNEAERIAKLAFQSRDLVLEGVITYTPSQLFGENLRLVQTRFSFVEAAWHGTRPATILAELYFYSEKKADSKEYEAYQEIFRSWDM
ncbi:hypothetical protein HYS50_01975 [Candidatus Woesearchaeota archaeon]|nr:hypothetical protein [Candidatus Woesearchaeota archaeon]